MRRPLVFASTSLAVALVIGCHQEEGESPPEANGAGDAAIKAKKEVKEAIESVKALAGAKVEPFRRAVQKKLAALDQRIDVLKKKAEQAATSGKVELKEQAQKLAAKRQALQKKLDELGSATAGAWEEMKAGLEAATKDLESAVDEAAGHYQEHYQEGGKSGE